MFNNIWIKSWPLVLHCMKTVRQGHNEFILWRISWLAIVTERRGQGLPLLTKQQCSMSLTLMCCFIVSCTPIKQLYYLKPKILSVPFVVSWFVIRSDSWISLSRFWRIYTVAPCGIMTSINEHVLFVGIGRLRVLSEIFAIYRDVQISVHIR